MVILLLLLLAVPALASNSTGRSFLDFAFSSTTGQTFKSARPLSQGINVNHLNPGEENWYVYSSDSFDDIQAGTISLALRYQSEAVISTAEANFQILTEAESYPASYSPAAPQKLGSGALVPAQPDRPDTTETFWAGQVDEQSDYYVRVFNHSPFRLEYSLMANVETSAVSGAVPAGLNTVTNPADSLSARQAAWTLTAQAVDNMTASDAAQWMQAAQRVGWLVTAGTASDQIPDPGQANPQTLWQLTAQAIEGQDAQTAAQWLTQADAMGWLTIPPATLKNPNEAVDDFISGGGDQDSDSSAPEPVPVPPDEPEQAYIPVNIYPNNPLDFNFYEVNSGRLAPDGEHWYQLHRDDLDEDLIEDLALTLFFTPSQGFVSNRVNFEIFPAGQYHIWQRGDADYMENMGAGMWVSRDKDPLTSERLWAGSLVDGDSYLVKIKNGSPEVVDYYLFPNDIWNAELGNPTLHKGDVYHGRIPYKAPPVTRSTGPVEPGTGPPEAVLLDVGTTTGKLDAGEEMWYKFHYSDPKNDDETEQDFIFYLTNTPLDDTRARHADFEIYPGSQLHLWVRGTVDELDPLGASAPATFAELEDERSLQVLWSGQLMKEHVYYVKVHNHDIGPLEYEFKIKAQ